MSVTDGARLGLVSVSDASGWSHTVDTNRADLVKVVFTRRGSEIAVSVKGSLERPRFEVRCKGPSARPPQALVDTIAAGEAAMLDALTIQAYYTCRLARTGDMRLQAGLDGPDVLILAEARN